MGNGAAGSIDSGRGLGSLQVGYFGVARVSARFRRHRKEGGLTVRSVGAFGHRGRAHFGDFGENVDSNSFKLTNVSGGRMKRNFSLLTLAAAGLWLLASAPAFATCPAGTEGTQLASGEWTIKIEGFATDTSTAAPAALIRHRSAKAATA